MTSYGTNRPFRTGANDRREYVFQDSEVALRTINDLNGNPIFLGRAKTGVSVDAPKWQIRQMSYDASQGVTSVTWPQNNDGNSSSNYEFIWQLEDNLTITGITKANPGVVTVSDLGDLVNGDKVIIQGVVGMTELNFDGADEIYTVANINSGAGTFELQGVNTSGFGVYTSGGSVNYSEAVNYTYQ